MVFIMNVFLYGTIKNVIMIIINNFFQECFYNELSILSFFFFFCKLHIWSLTLTLNVNLVLGFSNMSIKSLTLRYCVKMVFTIKWRMENVNVAVDTVFCSPSICMLDFENSKNIIFSPWGHGYIQIDVAQPIRASEHSKCLFQSN